MRLLIIGFLSLCLVALSWKSPAQSALLSAVQPPANGVCGGTTIEVAFTATGVFNTGNVFTVQLVSGSSDSPVYQNLLTTGTASPLRAVLPDSLGNGGFRLRVLASSPQTTGLLSTYFYPQSRPTATIIPRPNLTVARLEPVHIPVQVKGANTNGYYPYKMTVNDSLGIDRFAISEPGTAFVVNPSQTATYRVTSITNDCGVGKSYGEQVVTVTPFGLKAIAVVPEQACPGSVILMYFSTNGTFQAGNAFTVQAIDRDGKQIDLPTKGTSSPLEVTLPTNLPPNWAASIRVVSSAPVLMSNTLTNSYGSPVLTVYPPTAAALDTEVKTIRWGEATLLTVRLTGLNPRCLLSDGTYIESKSAGSYDRNQGVYTVTVAPKQGTTYSVSAASGGCGNATTSGAVRVEVAEGIIAGQLGDSRPCVGQPIRVGFQTNAQLTDKTTYKIKVGHQLYLTAKRQGDTLVATMTASDMAAYTTVTGAYSINGEVRIVTENPTIESTLSPTKLIPGYLPSLPVLGLRYTSLFGNEEFGYSPTFDKPTHIRLQPEFLGDDPLPTVFTITDGTRTRAVTYPAQRATANYSEFTAQSTTYGLTRIDNKCGSRAIQGILQRVTITNPVGNGRISAMELPLTNYCEKSTFQVRFTTENIPDTEGYRVVLITTYPTRTSAVIGTGAASPITVTLPSVARWGDARIRIQAISGPQQSQDIALYINKKPTFTLAPATAQLLEGEETGLSVALRGGPPFSLSMIDGSTYSLPTTGELNYFGDDQLIIRLKPVRTTAYTIGAVSNTCGRVDTTATSVVTVAPYKLLIYPNADGTTSDYVQAQMICQGSRLVIPYVTIGRVPADEQFEVEISRLGQSVFQRVPVLSAGNPLVIQLPDSVKGSPAVTYQLRVVGRKAGIVSVNTPSFNVFEPVSATLTLAANPPMNGSLGAYLDLNATGLVYSYGIENYTYRTNRSGDNGLIYVSPAQKTTYTLAWVLSGCGYGKVSGSITVKSKTSLVVQSPSPQQTVSLCGGGAALPIRYTLTGDFDTAPVLIAELLSKNDSFQWTELGRTASLSGVLSVTLPGTLPTDSYTIRVRVLDTDLQTRFYVSVAYTAQLKLGGDALINPGQRVTLPRIATGSFPMSYRLSDGTVGVLYSPTDQISVAPTVSTTYRLEGVSNVCGNGKAEGSSSVTVNPASARIIATDNLMSVPCGGDTVRIGFTAIGVSAGTFGVQVSDRWGSNYKALPVLGQQTVSPLRVLVPSDLPAGGGYRFRVVSSDASVVSAASLDPSTIRQRAVGTLSGSSFAEQAGKPVSLTVQFSGTPPFSYVLNKDGVLSTSVSYDTLVYLTALPARFPAYYILQGVTNECGTGRVPGTGQVRVDLVTGLEPVWSGWNVYPNPAQAEVIVESRQVRSATTQLTLHSIDGRLMHQQTILPRQPVRLSVRDLPPGTYLLHIRTDEAAETHKLFKL